MERMFHIYDIYLFGYLFDLLEIRWQLLCVWRGTFTWESLEMEVGNVLKWEIMTRFIIFPFLSLETDEGFQHKSYQVAEMCHLRIPVINFVHTISVWFLMTKIEKQCVLIANTEDVIREHPVKTRPQHCIPDPHLFTNNKFPFIKWGPW